MTDLGEAIDSTLVLLQRQLGEHSTVHREYGDLPSIYTSPGRLNQVFMNLLQNAINALDTGGQIRITTALDGETVRVEISDSGSSMSPEILEGLFDFQFRQEDGRMRMGMGLPMDYSTIRDLGRRSARRLDSGAGYDGDD